MKTSKGRTVKVKERPKILCLDCMAYIDAELWVQIQECKMKTLEEQLIKDMSAKAIRVFKGSIQGYY